MSFTTSQNVIPECSPLKACEDKIYRESRMSFDSGFPIGTLGNDKIGHSQYIGPGLDDQVFCFQINKVIRPIARHDNAWTLKFRENPLYQEGWLRSRRSVWVFDKGTHPCIRMSKNSESQIIVIPNLIGNLIKPINGVGHRFRLKARMTAFGQPDWKEVIFV